MKDENNARGAALVEEKETNTQRTMIVLRMMLTRKRLMIQR